MTRCFTTLTDENKGSKQLDRVIIDQTLMYLTLNIDTHEYKQCGHQSRIIWALFTTPFNLAQLMNRRVSFKKAFNTPPPEIFRLKYAPFLGGSILFLLKNTRSLLTDEDEALGEISMDSH